MFFSGRVGLRFGLRWLFLLVTVAAAISWWYLMPTEASRLRKMCDWLGEADEELGINFFASFIPMEPNRTETREFLDAWFRRTDHSTEYTFETIGVDGAGGHFATWHRPDEQGPLPLVFFTSDGGACILCESVWDWPLIMAHGVGPYEYDVYKDLNDVSPAEVDPNANEYLGNQRYVGRNGTDPDPYVQKAYERYRDGVEKKHGELPPLNELLSGRDELRREFAAWIQKCRESAE